MPPRIQSHHVQLPTSCQCFRTRPRTFAEPLMEGTRQFHCASHLSSPKRRSTRLRRDMFEWLNGPGKAFREPLLGSTNYMSAYDKEGNLLRTKKQRSNQSEDGRQHIGSEAPVEEEENIVRKEIEDGLDEAERQETFQVRQAARLRKANADIRAGVPKEKTSDLHPFPLNQNFRSQPVLSEDLREAIYEQVVGKGTDVGTVSAALSVDIRRVAAVVRLKTIEKQWVAEGKKLAKPYNDAVLAMLPQTAYRDDQSADRIVAHETINDLPVHPKTRQQIFYPVSESRQFTREDAAKAFDDNLLPADQRIPHPELVTLEKESLAGLDRKTRWARQLERDEKVRKDREEATEKQKRWEERSQRVVAGRRWNFKFQDISAEKTGKDGRSRQAVGARYGMPHEDRKRGIVKIPTSVE